MSAQPHSPTLGQAVTNGKKENKVGSSLLPLPANLHSPSQATLAQLLQGVA